MHPSNSDSALPAPVSFWKVGARTISLVNRPVWMGILNVTPDSFSDGGAFLDIDAAVAQATSLERDGAGILDIGGESTRPGATPVPVEEELRRVIPVLQQVARAVSIPISIDTYKARVARAALEAGASIINDVSGLTYDPEMLAVCRDFQTGIVCMHLIGTPQTMQNNPQYTDVVKEIREVFEQRLESLSDAGVAPESVCFDPGIGFGKTAEHNLQILAAVNQLRVPGSPLMIGHSRKRFLKKVLQREVDERLPGTIGVSIALALQGVDVLRVHDVLANRDAWTACQTVAQAAQSAVSSH